MFSYRVRITTSSKSTAALVADSATNTLRAFANDGESHTIDLPFVPFVGLVIVTPMVQGKVVEVTWNVAANEFLVCV